MGDFFSALLDIFGSETMYGSAVRLGGFLAFAALGELVAEKAGTINISVEGSLLAGAFAGTVGYHLTESSVVGLAAGVDDFQHIGVAGGALFPDDLLGALRARAMSGRPLYWTPTVGLPLHGESRPT